VNGRTKRLGGSARKEVLAHVKGVVADALGRLDADFSEDALYLCLEAFDLPVWEEMIRNLRIRDQVAELPAQVRALRQTSKTLFEAVGVGLQWAMCFSEQQTSRSRRAALLAEVPKHLRNRVAWADLRQRRAVNPQKRPAPYWPWNQPCVFIGPSGTAQATSRDPSDVFVPCKRATRVRQRVKFVLPRCARRSTRKGRGPKRTLPSSPSDREVRSC